MLHKTTYQIAQLLPTSEHNVYQNITTLQKLITRNKNRKEKKKRCTPTPVTNVHLMPCEKRSKFLSQTDGSHENYDLKNASTWSNQLRRLNRFQSQLNKKKSCVFDSDSFPVVFDSGTSSTNTNDKDDFIPDSFK